jgi:uncharacterized damage-inducible protein DinB
MRFTEVLLVEFDREAGFTRRVLERVPQARLSWQPHAKSMSLGRLVNHLVELPAWGSALVARDGYDLSERPAANDAAHSIADSLVAFDRNIAALRQALAARTDGELLAPWTLRSEGREVFTVPRLIALRSLLLEHSTHHRGQLTVYLRLLDVPLPALYGPSADEGRF